MLNKALTLVEVIISMVIFSLIMAGLANLFVATKRLTLHAQSRMMLGELCRYFLDPLQMYVNQSDWEGSDYSSGNPLHLRENEEGPEIEIDGISYKPTYTVSTPPGLPASQMRKVKLVVSYPASVYE